MLHWAISTCSSSCSYSYNSHFPACWTLEQSPVAGRPKFGQHGLGHGNIQWWLYLQGCVEFAFFWVGPMRPIGLAAQQVIFVKRCAEIGGIMMGVPLCIESPLSSQANAARQGICPCHPQYAASSWDAATLSNSRYPSVDKHEPPWVVRERQEPEQWCNHHLQRGQAQAYPYVLLCYTLGCRVLGVRVRAARI